MSFRDRIQAFGPARREIALDTHLGSHIPNETTDEFGQISLGRQKAEARFASIFTRVREPVAGYNCYGHVFACRRTAIYPEDDEIIKMILAEDGFGEITYNDLRVGDVVVYSDERGIDHVARIIAANPRPSGLVFSDAVRGPLSFLVRSKFNDVSGEYEHALENTGWSPSRMEMRFYRDRHQKPYKKGWRGLVARVGDSWES